MQLSRIITFGAAVLALAWLAPTWNVAGQGARTTPAAASAQLIEDLVAGNRILANEGVLDGYGHISARHDKNPNRFLLSRDLAPALVTAADLMEFDLNGDPVEAQGRRMYQERFIHAAIYKTRPDVRVVIHSHTPSILPFASSTVELRPMYHMADFLVPGVPVWDIRRSEGSIGMLVNTPRLGASLADALGDKAVALMRGHGAVIVGPSVGETVSRGVILDVNARVQSQAMALGGTLRYLTPQDLGVPTSAPQAGSAYPRSWEAWKQKAMGK